MQINGIKDDSKIVETVLKAADSEVKESEKPGDKIGIGEAFNKNIRTKALNYGDTINKLKEDGRELSKFKEEAEKSLKILEYNAKALSPEIIKELEEEGVSAKNSAADLVKKSIANIVEGREIRKENLERQAEKLSEAAENIKEISYDSRLVRQLENSGMAVTKENLAKLSSALNFAKEVINNINEPAISRMVEEDMPETISNIYMAEHSHTNHSIAVEKDGTWSLLETQAATLLENQGIMAGEESLGAAKWLFTKGMEITPASVAKYLSLNELKNEAGSSEGIDNLAKKLTRGLSEGKEALNSIVGNANYKQAGYIVNYFRRTTEITITEISQRRNLEEIRLKLTEQSAVRMLDKGIKIDVTDLKGLVENLRKEEESYYKELLEGAAVLEDDEKASGGKLLKDYNLTKKDSAETGAVENGSSQISLLRSVVSIRSYALSHNFESDYKRGAVYAAYLEETKLTLSTYHKAGIAYEKGGTEIRSDLGDSLSKAFGNIDEVLRENGLELSEANRKAVKLLVYNKAELSTESVTKMKAAALLTENTLKELKPATVAGLIKSGINPLDLEMGELFKAAKEINEKVLPADEKYSRYLYNLEKSGELNETEREAYIGIYRLLNQIEKGDEAAVGSVSLMEQSLTLRNMLSAVRTRKLGGFSEKIDDSFGELTEVLGGENKIDNQIDSSYAKLLAGELKESLSEAGDDYYETYEAEIIKEIQLNDVEKLLDARAEITFSNLAAQMDAAKGRRSLLGLVSSMTVEEKRELNELSSKFIDEFDSERFAAENEKAVTDALSKKATKMMEDEKISYDRFKGLMAVRKTIALSIKREESQTYEIPFIYDEDKLADLSVTLRKGRAEKDKGKVGIILTTKETRVSSEFRIVSERITGYFRVDSRESLDNLKTNEEALKKSLSELKLEIGEISYHLGEGTLQITNSDDIYNDNVKTSDIYKAAKAVTAYILKAMGIRG